MNQAAVKTARSRLKGKWRRNFENHRRTSKSIVVGKSDLKSAFRILGLSQDSWKWLVMKAQNPVTGEWMYFVDKCLPFGSSVSCIYFQRFLDALHHLIEHRLQVRNRVTNYLDDFLFIARTILQCNFMIQHFLNLCKELGVPVSMEKMEWTLELIVFLGILLDGKNMLLAVPEQKKQKAIELLQQFSKLKKVTVGQLQKLCGYLNFLNKAIFPGRAFTR